MLTMRARHANYRQLVIPLPLESHEFKVIQNVLSGAFSKEPTCFETFHEVLNKNDMRVTRMIFDKNLDGDGTSAHMFVSNLHDKDESNTTCFPVSFADAMCLSFHFGCPILATEEYVNNHAQNKQISVDIVSAYNRIHLQHKDPTLELQIKKEIAIVDENYELAAEISKQISDTLYSHVPTQLLVAMTTAMESNRYTDVAHYIDEYKRHVNHME